MPRSTFLVSVLLAAVLTVTTGCDRNSSSKGQGSAQDAVAEVRLGYFGNLTHAQAVLGVESGDFEKEVAPAKLTTRVFNAGPSLIEALFADAIDIGYVGPSPAISAVVQSHGQGIRIVSGACANGVVIVARKGSGITKLDDLKDKRVATPQLGNTQDVSARHYLKAVLKQEDLKNVRPVANAEQSAMMARGEIDAAWAPEPWGSRLVVETGGTIIGQEKDLWPEKSFATVLVVTTPQFLGKHPDVVEKVLRVHARWTKTLSENPSAQLPLLETALTRINGKKLPAGVLPMALGSLQFTNDPLTNSIATMGQWSYDLDLSRDPVKLDRVVNLTVLKKVEAAK